MRQKLIPCFVAAALVFTGAVGASLLTADPAFAGKATPATDKNTNVPAVPRAIPNLIPYHKFDPPKAADFDLKNLTISGDMRVRPEFRSKSNFNVSRGTNANGEFTRQKNGSNFFTQQLIRLGFNYDISPDVVFFAQPQVSHNWGTVDPDRGSGGINPNGTGSDLFLRQGFMLVRNFVVPNLSLKAGRQLMVWGNHRMFGHFDWNNVGFAFDGVTMRYNHATVPVELGWLRVAEGDCNNNAGGCGNATASADTFDGDIFFVRFPMKFSGVAIEPAWIWEDQGASGQSQDASGASVGAFPTVPGTAGSGASVAGGSPPGGQPQNQTRHTVGGRVATKKGIVDVTGEGYYQFGSLGAVGGGRNQNISAYAVHADAGVTLPVPMQPRIGAEINYASGDKNCNVNRGGGAKCGGTFSQLFPTNHIHFGYMDQMSWQNMLTYGGNLQLRPTKESHFEIAGHIMRLAKQNDNWYGASQAVNKFTPDGNNEKSLGGEIDVVYTLFFQNNKVGWQLGYGHFFVGDYLTKNDAGSLAKDQNWGYTQLWVNF